MDLLGKVVQIKPDAPGFPTTNGGRVAVVTNVRGGLVDLELCNGVLSQFGTSALLNCLIVDVRLVGELPDWTDLDPRALECC